MRAFRPFKPVVALVAALAVTCSDPGGPTLAHLGRYHAELYVPPPPPVYPTSTPDGEFVATLTNRHGRAGKVGDRLAYWPMGAAAPEYLFRADTNPAAIVPLALNARGEIILRLPQSGIPTNAIYIWRAGEVKTIVSSGFPCWIFNGINNRGLIILSSCAELYDRYYKFVSPFGPPDTAQFRRFVGGSCASGGRYNSIIALNDSNEVIAIHEKQPTQGSATSWFAGGCRDLSAVFPTAEWQSFSNIGLVGGNYVKSGAQVTTAVLTDGTNVATVNDLLDDASRAKWYVTSIDRILDDRAMVVHAMDLATGQSVQLQLTPLP